MTTEIIIALDTYEWKQAYRIIEKLGHDKFYKVGLELFTSLDGHDAVSYLIAAEVPVFLDLKLNDIPTTVERTVTNLAGLYPELKFLSVRGSAQVGAALRGVMGTDIQICAVPALSSEHDTGVAVPTAAPAVVCRPGLASQYRHAGHTVIAVGIRSQVSSFHHDHVAPAGRAPDAQYAVVGRAITEYGDLRAGYDAIYRELNGG